MTNQDEKSHIIQMLEQGKITAGEAAQLLEALREDDMLESGELPEEEAPEQQDGSPEVLFEEGSAYQENPAPASPELPPEMRRWRNYWVGLFLIAFGALMISTFFMYRAIENSGYGFWFFCSWIPFLLSVAAVALAWQSRSTPWLHLRIDQAKDEWPRRIAFSFPLPLGLASWILHVFGHRIPGLNQAGLELNDIDKLIFGLKDYTSPEHPIYIEVDEDDGEKVLIYIG
jgi:hypothetical protein